MAVVELVFFILLLVVVWVCFVCVLLVATASVISYLLLRIKSPPNAVASSYQHACSLSVCGSGIRGGSLGRSHVSAGAAVDTRLKLGRVYSQASSWGSWQDLGPRGVLP